MLSAYEIIRRPIITEKTTMLGDRGQYAFEVARTANKVDVKRAVEQIFKVNVRAVNVMHVRGKPRRMGRMGRSMGMTTPWKKAVVTLQEGQRIELFQGV
jgi:large subunit ribosomal protein L23